MNVHFLISGDIHKLTGGSIYNERIISGLKTLGHEVLIHRLNDDYPFPSDESLKQCKREIAGIPVGEPVIIDSLVFGVIPEFLKVLVKTNPIIAIIHLPLTQNPGYTNCERDILRNSENEALKYAKKCVVTSSYTEGILINLGIDKNKVEVIVPGVDDYPQKKVYKNSPSKLLCISNYTPGKGFIVLVSALNRLKDCDWELRCYGNLNFNAEYVTRLKKEIQINELDGKIQLHSPLARNELSDVYLFSDLFIHPSSFETYGMALTEALMHGIPVVASSGGGIRQTVPAEMGRFFEPGDATGLSFILGELFETPILYRKLCDAASNYPKQANSWHQSISLFEALLDKV